jgi:hypothetical protein
MKDKKKGKDNNKNCIHPSDPAFLDEKGYPPGCGRVAIGVACTCTILYFLMIPVLWWLVPRRCYKKKFAELDPDGSGYIGEHELTEFLESTVMKRKVQTYEVKDAMELLDSNKDNQISFDELVSYLGDPATKMKAVFNAMERDEPTLPVAELDHFVRNLLWCHTNHPNKCWPSGSQAGSISLTRVSMLCGWLSCIM